MEGACAPTTVRIRFRPANAKESGRKCVACESDQQIAFCGCDGSQTRFLFDKVYDETSSQEQTFNDLTFIINAVLEGYNGTIITYGQTGSGKTHTLIGDLSKPASYGIVPRAVRYLSQGIAAAQDEASFSVTVSVAEIYCERVRDLLDPAQDNLQIKSDSVHGVYIQGATELRVSSDEEFVCAVQDGLAQRTVSATCMNEASSRSHCIVTALVERQSNTGVVQIGKLCMVDLAGSERQDKTQASGQTLQEGSQINKSLSCLANVIYALTDDKIKHVPYRESKLTRVLQDSLGGTAKTVLIICCSPCMDNSAETLSSLRFGSRAKGVTSTVQVNQKIDVSKVMEDLNASRALVQELQQQLADCQFALQQSRALADARHAFLLEADSLPPAAGQQRVSLAGPAIMGISAERLAQLLACCVSTLLCMMYLTWERWVTQLV